MITMHKHGGVCVLAPEGNYLFDLVFGDVRVSKAFAIDIFEHEDEMIRTWPC